MGSDVKLAKAYQTRDPHLLDDNVYGHNGGRQHGCLAI